jgi:hypothetical protein
MKFDGLNREDAKNAKKAHKKLRELRSFAVKNKSRLPAQQICCNIISG